MGQSLLWSRRCLVWMNRSQRPSAWRIPMHSPLHFLRIYSLAVSLSLLLSHCWLVMLNRVSLGQERWGRLGSLPKRISIGSAAKTRIHVYIFHNLIIQIASRNNSHGFVKLLFVLCSLIKLLVMPLFKVSLSFGRVSLQVLHLISWYGCFERELIPLLLGTLWFRIDCRLGFEDLRGVEFYLIWESPQNEVVLRIFTAFDDQVKVDELKEFLF